MSASLSDLTRIAPVPRRTVIGLSWSLHHDRTSALHAARRCGLSSAAAALILRTGIDRAGGNVMRGPGDYHSATPQLNRLYRVRAWAIASRLSGMHKGKIHRQMLTFVLRHIHHNLSVCPDEVMKSSRKILKIDFHNVNNKRYFSMSVEQRDV